MPYRILLRRDTLTNWVYNDPVLMSGEPGYETDTGRMKLGDGQNPWTNLPYYSGVTGPQGPIGPTGPTGQSIIVDGSTPSDDSTIIAWGKVTLNTGTYWLPLYQ